MAAKKTSKTSSSGKTTRPAIPSSHTSSIKPERAGKPAARGAARGATGATGGGRSVAKPAAKSARPAARLRPPARRGTPLAVPKRATADAGPRAKRPRASAPATPGASMASDQSRDLAIAIAVAGLEKKAVGLEILDVAGKVDYADFLVVMTGRSDRQVAALAQGIEEALRNKGKRAISVEGLPHASWVLMDFGDVVVHVFQDETRSLYDIEGLWMDARRIPVPDDGRPEDGA